MKYTELETEEKIKIELPYGVTLTPNYQNDGDRLFDREKWCKGRFGNAASLGSLDGACVWDDSSIWINWWYDGTKAYRFSFRNAKDAVEFKLRWG